MPLSFLPLLFSFAVFIILSFGILRSFRLKNYKLHNYSIIIACRNEEQNLPALFSFLERIDYPKDKYEIILVDDASSDNSLLKIKEFCKDEKNRRYFHFSEKSTEYKGKKAALKKATDNAKYDIFLFTDADCLPPSNWLKSYNNYISNKTGMVVGFSPEIDVSKFRKFTQLMSANIICSTIGLGLPFSAIGRNLAIKKKAFDKVGGFERIKNYQCGEDKLLLNFIKKTEYKIAYNSDVKVPTRPEKIDFHNQQKRRYGQFGKSSQPYKILSILITLFYIYLPIKIFTFRKYEGFIIYFIAFLIFWISGLIKHKEKFHCMDLISILIYPYYLIFYSIVGIFWKLEWKKE